MPILMCKKEAEGHNIPFCCGEEMKVAGRWYHCFKCNNKFIRVDYGKEKSIIRELLEEEIQGNMLLWKEIKEPIHDIWLNASCDEYIKPIPKDWL